MSTTPHPLLAETVLTLTQAAGRLPGAKGCRHPNPTTLLRWVIRGAKARDGRRVRLDAVKLPGGWRTSAEALGRFLAAIGPEEPAPARPSPAARRKAGEAAGRRLEAMGL